MCSLSTAVSDVSAIRAGAGSAANYSIDAAALYPASTSEVLIYVGGGTTDYITVTLPTSCNFFDGSTICQEQTYMNLTVFNSSGGAITSNAQACTTAHRQSPWPNDAYDEFGLHLIDGNENSSAHCHVSNSSLGHQNNGRIYTTFNQSNGGHWGGGVHSHWNESGSGNQPGFIMLR